MNLFALELPWYELVGRAVLIYLAMLVVFRVFGKREVGQFTMHDLVFVLLVANVVQPAVTGPDTTALGGLMLVITLAALNHLISRVPFLDRLFIPRPTVLVRNGRLLKAVMRREGVEPEEIDTALRENGLDDLARVKTAVLEPDGNISVVPRDGSGRRGTDKSKSAGVS